MGLSVDLISQFAKITNDNPEQKRETTVYGTVVYDGRPYVRLDGSELLTPVTTTAAVKDGERVSVLIKNHAAMVTGNISSPSASDKDVKELGTQISEFEIVIADKVSVSELDAQKARIDSLITDNLAVKETLTATEAIIGDLLAADVTIQGRLDANDASIENLEVTKADISVLETDYATIDSLNATNAIINNLEATYGDFTVLVTDKFSAIDADFENLNAKYVNLDYSNIDQAWIDEFYAKSSFIESVTADEVTTTYLEGVIIRGGLIEGGTIIADKLVVKGEDGLYHKLNVEAGVVASEEVTEEQLQNGLHGDNIIAKTVTAEKIRVSDLVAFGATIGGFHITDDSIYSGVKESVDNTTRGIYLDDDGQIALGDSTNYLKFYKEILYYKVDLVEETTETEVDCGEGRITITQEMIDSGLYLKWVDPTITPTDYYDVCFWLEDGAVASEPVITSLSSTCHDVGDVDTTNIIELFGSGLEVGTVVDIYTNRGFHAVYMQKNISYTYVSTDEKLGVLDGVLMENVSTESGDAVYMIEDSEGKTIYYYISNDEKYKLEISADSILFGNESKTSTEDLKELTEHVKIGTYTEGDETLPCVELSEGDSDFKMRLTNKAATFMDGSTSPTTIDFDGVSTENVTVENEFRMVKSTSDRFIWAVRSNGNLGLIWEEVSE